MCTEALPTFFFSIILKKGEISFPNPLSLTKPLLASTLVHKYFASVETKSLSSSDSPSSVCSATLCLFATLSSSTGSSIFG